MGQGDPRQIVDVSLRRIEERHGIAAFHAGSYHGASGAEVDSETH
ncbi:MAG: hypothetical protein QM784_38350 [Polyangiaceae bacterium]